ncbi:MAG: long-chain fatty acid--CoA ligase [Actinobacteria bacterium]|nr:long-chain fatty acid--CoA ligase [Actinomycetota bacterium]
MAVSTDEELRELVKGRTVLSEFLNTVDEVGSQVAVRWLEGDDLVGWTFDEIAAQAARVAQGLKDLGVKPGDFVVMMLRNIAEFHVADLAVLATGATPVSIYNSSSPEQISYIVNHCGATAAIAEDDGFLERFLNPAATPTPSLASVVIVKPTESTAEQAVRWSDLLASEPLDLRDAAAALSPSDIATVIYTSGTTGSPKGVVLDHENICWTVESLRETVGTIRPGWKTISYLPMAHVAERAVSHYGGMMLRMEVTCCPDMNSIAAYAGKVRPNMLFGVPRVFEKIHAGITAVLAADPDKATKVAEAVEAAIPLREKMTWGTATEEDIATYEFLDAVAFSTIRELLGMDELELMVSGAAPLNPDLFSWFRAIGIPLSEIYGMSESCGPITFSPHKPLVGTVGTPCAGVSIKLDPDGEVLFSGGNVFKRYLNDEANTVETIDADGWVHTGDIGEIDEHGYLRIVDRKKELIITAGGKNISPSNLENALKSIPVIGQAFAVGDGRPFVAAIVVLDHANADLWAAAHGKGHLTIDQLAEDPELLAHVDEEVKHAMTKFNAAERVKKVKVLHEEWMPDTDLMTPTQKLKRRGLRVAFANEIEALYA